MFAQARGRIVAQGAAGFGHFQGVADGAAQRLVHIGDQGDHIAPGGAPDGHHFLGQLARLGVFGGEGAAAHFDIQHDALGAAGQLLAHDAGGNQGDAVDRRRHVTQGVELAIGRREVGTLSGEGESDLFYLRAHLRHAELVTETGDRFDLIQGAAGVAEAAAAHLDDGHATGGHQRQHDQRGRIAQTPGGMFIDGVGEQVGPIQLLARGSHRESEGGGFGAGHAAQEDGHEEGGGLVIGQLVARVGLDEMGDFAFAEGVAIALAGDDIGELHGNGPLVVGQVVNDSASRNLRRVLALSSRKKRERCPLSPGT